MTIGRNKIDLFIILLWVAFSTELLFRSFHKYSLYLIIPFLFLRSVIITPDLFKNKYVIAYIVIMFWSLITCFTSIDLYQSLSAYVIMGGGFMASCIVYSFAIKSKSTLNDVALSISYMALFFTTLIYLYTSGSMFDIDIDSDRLDGENMNSNDIAYYLFAFVVSAALVIKKSNCTGLLKTILAVILILLNLACAVLTGSRQFLVVVLPVTIVSVLFFLRGIDRRQNVLNIVFLIGIASILILRYQSEISDIISNSFLMNRMHDNIQEDGRSVLLKQAFSVGLTHPILGVGPGCFALYNNSPFSHCTYLELFANSGLIPMIAFIYMVVAFIRDQWKRYMLTKDKLFYYLFLVGCFWAVYNFFYAFHTAAWVIAFFFLLIGYSENKYRTYIRIN